MEINVYSSGENQTTQDVLHKMLLQRAGGDPNASLIAQAAFSIWHQMSIQLTPVIGRRGVEALFRRSIHLMGCSYPWLAVDESFEKSDSGLFERFRSCIRIQEPVVAIEASRVLLETFTELLSNLIGKSLTNRLLSPVWASLPPGPGGANHE